MGESLSVWGGGVVSSGGAGSLDGSTTGSVPEGVVGGGVSELLSVSEGDAPAVGGPEVVPVSLAPDSGGPNSSAL